MTNRTDHDHDHENVSELNIIKLIQDMRGDFQRELEQMRSQMYYLKQPIPPPWITPPHFLPPQMEQPTMNSHLNNSQQMDALNMSHQIHANQVPLYRDMLLRQQQSAS